MQSKLEKFEARLKSLIEVRLLSVLPGFKVQDLVIQKIAEAIQTNTIEDMEGRVLAPNVFTLVVHPDMISIWQEPQLLESIITSLKTVAEEQGYLFIATPTITITQKPGQEENVIEVMASHQVETAADTRGMTPAQEGDVSQSADAAPQNAFLIVNGIKAYPLIQSVINIGRRMDNQLIIDDPRISRNHAQLRAIKGRYIIFDLNSTGGTYVNGQKVSQSVLYPGDVISLAGVTLVFGQDIPPSSANLADTSPFQPPSLDRPTAILNRETGKFKNNNQK